MNPDAYIAKVATEFGLTKSDLIDIIMVGALDLQTRHFAEPGKESEIEVVVNKEKLRENIKTLMREIQRNKTGTLFPLRD